MKPNDANVVGRAHVGVLHNTRSPSTQLELVRTHMDILQNARSNGSALSPLTQPELVRTHVDVTADATGVAARSCAARPHRRCESYQPRVKRRARVRVSASTCPSTAGVAREDSVRGVGVRQNTRSDDGGRSPLTGSPGLCGFAGSRIAAPTWAHEPGAMP